MQMTRYTLSLLKISGPSATYFCSRFRTTSPLTCSLHQPICNYTRIILVTVTLPWWLKSYSFLRWMSSHQKKSCTKTTAFGQAWIAPLDIIYSESILVWSKKKDVTKGKFSSIKINSTETRDWSSNRQTCLHGFLALLPVKSLVLS